MAADSLSLNFEERRVLGTLVEKAYTTPEQCPLSLNSLVNGCNQKSCRDPVSCLDEGLVLDTLDALRERGLVVQVRSVGSRVDRWRQCCADVLSLSPKENAVLAELLLRGPQTDGELRQRASRMVKLESLADVDETLRSLMEREPPLAARQSPPGRKRGVKFMHTLYAADEPHAPTIGVDDTPEASVEVGDRPRSARSSALEEEVASLRAELHALAERVDALEADPTV